LNEERKDNIHKAKLPTKTKLAVLSIYMIGVAGILFTVTLGWKCPIRGTCNEEWFYFFLFIMIISFVLYGLSGIFLQIGTGWGWFFSIILTFFPAILLLILPTSKYRMADTVFLIPLALLIIDQKNYFEFVRQRKLAKENKKDNS